MCFQDLFRFMSLIDIRLTLYMIAISFCVNSLLRNKSLISGMSLLFNLELATAIFALCSSD